MSQSAKNHQTHDPFGREFTEPIPGGPIDGKVNLIIGEAKNGEVMISCQKDDESFEIFGIGGYGEDGPNKVEKTKILSILRPVTKDMKDYKANVAYYTWYKAFVGNGGLKASRKKILECLDKVGLDYDLG